MKYSLTFFAMLFSFSTGSFAASTLNFTKAKVNVNSGWSGSVINIGSKVHIPATEEAAVQALELQGKGIYTCDVKIATFATGSGEGKGLSQVYAIKDCTELN